VIEDDTGRFGMRCVCSWKMKGHFAQMAGSGAAALALFKEEGFDAVLLDLNLGSETGLDLLPQILRNYVMRDPTRGGVASALKEIAEQAKIGVHLDEASIPISEEVKGACEIRGFDPLYVANEGKLLAIVPPEGANVVLDAMRRHPLGQGAAIIGDVVENHPGFVTMRTRVGGNRVVDMLSGE
jgi:hydrogenase maturation factor